MMRIVNIPNLITLARIICVPILVNLILYQRLREATWLFAAMAISDAVDGAIARIFHQKTPLGTILDPIADKALVFTSYVSLTALHLLPLWLTILVVSRDLILILGGVVIELMTRRLTVIPSIFGKVTTFFSMLTVFLVLYDQAPELHFVHRTPSDLVFIASLATAVFTVVSGIDYVYRGLLQLHPDDRGARRNRRRIAVLWGSSFLRTGPVAGHLASTHGERSSAPRRQGLRPAPPVLSFSVGQATIRWTGGCLPLREDPSGAYDLVREEIRRHRFPATHLDDHPPGATAVIATAVVRLEHLGGNGKGRELVLKEPAHFNQITLSHLASLLQSTCCMLRVTRCISPIRGEIKERVAGISPRTSIASPSRSDSDKGPPVRPRAPACRAPSCGRSRDGCPGSSR
jgi:cardiolipin synthase